MYRPPAFREERLETLHALIAAHPLATLITAGADGLNANLIPFTIATDRGEKGTLRAHLAKANDQIQALRDSAEALVIFQGSPLLAQSGHGLLHCKCPLSGVKRT